MADSDKDGLISREDFVKFFTNSFDSDFENEDDEYNLKL